MKFLMQIANIVLRFDFWPIPENGICDNELIFSRDGNIPWI